MSADTDSRPDSLPARTWAKLPGLVGPEMDDAENSLILFQEWNIFHVGNHLRHGFLTIEGQITMAWEVLLDEDFSDWLDDLGRNQRTSTLAPVQLFTEYGPNLSRPHVDGVKGSRLQNLKELRVQIAGEPWRVLFAFDPKRQAVLLVGGNKAGDKRWYKKNIPIAEERFQQHLGCIS